MKRQIPLLAVLIFSVIFFLINEYVLSGFHTLSTNPVITPLFWAIVLLSAGTLIYSIRNMQRLGMGMLFKITTHAFLILLVSELIFSLFLALGDTYRLISGNPRNLYWVSFALCMFLLTILVFVYGMVRGKYAYRVIKHTLFFDELPKSFDGFTIVQISDVHAGSFNNSKALQKGIDLIKAQKAELFVFTGDLVNNKAEEIEPWIGHFSQVKAPFGQFSILGNHDYGDYVQWKDEHSKKANLEQLKRNHAALGYRLLLDEHVEIEKDGEKIILAGVENWGIGFGERGDLKKAMRNVRAEDFKVLLSHDPTHWEAQVKTDPVNVQLTLAGHTHGMQFGLEIFGIKWSPVKYRYAHWAGLKTENGRYLNINRGFGFLGFSGRVGIWPEITLIELKRK